MNRFFSKLDLRDIKIDPEGTRFPPDADEAEESGEQQQETTKAVNTPVETEEVEVTTWESPTYSNGSAEPTAAEAEEATNLITETEEIKVEAKTSVVESNGSASNGHYTGYAVEGVVVGADGEVLKVSARSRPSAVAGAIAGVVREAGRAEVQAIGAGATNQAVKAVAIAREYLRETGIDAICVPAFIDVTIENEDRTAIRLVVEAR